MTPRRPQTETEQIEESFLAKRARDRAAAEALAAPHEIDDPKTGVIPRGPELDAARDDRDPLDRIRHLEHRLDEAHDDREALQARVAEVEKSRDELLGKIVDMAERGFSAKLEIGKDSLAARKQWRDTIIRGVLYVCGLIAAAVAGKKL